MDNQEVTPTSPPRSETSAILFKRTDDAVWISADEETAIAEGWNMFTVAAEPGLVLELQRYDESGIFEDDECAVSFVRARARAGSEFHQLAIRLHGGVLTELYPEKGAESDVTTLPADPEKMNDARARSAGIAMDAFVLDTRTDPEDSLGDLLTNLHHWADRNNFDFDAALERAQRNYSEETCHVA